jgi:hypothetical protein
MLWGNALLTAVISVYGLAPAPAKDAAVTLYRIELSGGETVWAEDKPRDAGASVLFHRYPGGLLVSLKNANVRRVVESRFAANAARTQRKGKPGDLVVLGETGAGAALPETTGGAERALLPGERPDGTALLNPDRPFKPDWDTKHVPGLNLAYPNSPNDYREGRTYAYPPAGATQQSPGDVPRMPEGNGDLPRGPQQPK